MQNAATLRPSIPVTDRLSMRLALLFVGTFLVVFILLAAWTMLTTIGDRQRAAANSEVATPAIVIDPKIQSELAKALAFDGLPATTEVLNPFLDRAGIGGSASTAVVSAAPPASRPGASAVSGRSSGTISDSRTAPDQTGLRLGPASVMESYSVKERHDDWVARVNKGEFVGPESEVLAVEDLVPVGFASGGDRGAEVMLLSISLCQTFSFPAGTRFSNGWLYGFDKNEVVFTFQEGIRRKSYSSTEACRPSDSQVAH